jgi:hypothetical protein
MHARADVALYHTMLHEQADIETTYLEADQGYCTDLRDEVSHTYTHTSSTYGQGGGHDVKCFPPVCFAAG